MTGDLFLKFVRGLTFGFLLIALCALASHAQVAGTVGIKTNEVQVFTNQSTTLSSGGTWQCNNSTTPISCAVLPDIGAGCGSLSYQTTNFTGTITLEWSPPIANSATLGPFIVLTQAFYQAGNLDTANHTLSLNGYYPNLRSTVTPIAGSLSAEFTSGANQCPYVYSGIGSTGPSSPINCDQNVAQGAIPSGATSPIVGISATGDRLVICGFTLSFSGVPSAGVINLNFYTSSSCSSAFTEQWTMYTTSATPQVIPVATLIRGPVIGAQYLCVQNSSGVNIALSFSFASVHGI
jgi:hypothetical protein